MPYDNDLEKAVTEGNTSKVQEILTDSPKKYMQLTESSTNRTWLIRKRGNATLIHLAVIEKKYDMVEFLLKNPDSAKIINIEDSAGESILHSIVQISDQKQALKLTAIALDIETIDVNAETTWFYGSTALSYAYSQKHLQIALLLLKRGANPNIILLEKFSTNSLLLKLAKDLCDTCDRKTLGIINEWIFCLLQHGADPKQRVLNGNFFDIVSEAAKSKLQQRNKEILDKDWKTSSSKEIQIARETFLALVPFRKNSPDELQSPTLKDTALLVTLKKERRNINDMDYACTVLDNKSQLYTFLELAKLRYQSTNEPFSTQFIIRPRDNGIGPHVANGQLSFDDQGKVHVFWVDTLGNDFYITKAANASIELIIHGCLPTATLYTTDIEMQHTETG